MEHVAAICYRLKNELVEYLLVRTLAGRWTFPKGEVDPGEERWSAAQREAFEEAGVTGIIDHKPLTTYLHAKKAWEEDGQETSVCAFLLEVKKTQKPEESYRKPKWFSFPDAEANLIKGRPVKYKKELLRVLHEANNLIARRWKNN